MRSRSGVVERWHTVTLLFSEGLMFDDSVSLRALNAVFLLVEDTTCFAGEFFSGFQPHTTHAYGREGVRDRHFLPPPRRKFYPATADMLLAAFQYFDTEKRGYVTKERFKQLMMEEGEPFTEDEYDEMMQIALDPITDTITYEYYINHLITYEHHLRDDQGSFLDPQNAEI
ncbi:Dynein regulatory complex protein 8 [Eumeta japonica]|uniref:Dynein regulatory complex protein 8 n=1 Tax=Eumeta variegata TaxID=151549 RepID=A0A4C1WBV1_EUMVA|nr:Dynein regulatory complex protein 8 [Eumeta japonica]